AFDAYFAHAVRRSQTSANVFTQIIQPLSADEYATGIQSAFYQNPSQTLSESLFRYHRAYFSGFMRELDEGFNLFFYGLGSKRRLLNIFTTSYLRKRGETIVLNAYHPNFLVKDLIPACAKVRGIADLPLTSGGIESHLQRVAQLFSASSCKRQLYIVIHNLDAPVLRSSKARALLSILLSSSNIRMIGSLDHLNAPLLFDPSGLFSAGSSSLSTIQNSWLWHDLTSLEGYNIELAFADKSSIRGASSRAQVDVPTVISGTGGTQMTESAAQHVLLSVTNKAKKLFALLARHQLDAGGESEGMSQADQSMAYDQLFTIARDNFVATSDGALRTLLGEFRDHGLVVTTSTGTLGAAEMLWIPMRKERLTRLV
ncbi:origin recognition complex, subunit 2, partial [Vararia minispora EC-137]